MTGTEKGGAEPRGPCAVCGLDSGLLCSRCRGAFYCGAAHQREHWPHHRASCGACYEVRRDDTLGRHLVAVKDIKQGDVVIKEKPIVVYPNWDTPSCGNCCKLAEYWSPCERCGLPLCSADCVRSLGDKGLHTDAECVLFKKNRVSEKFPMGLARTMLMTLGTLRCLLLDEKKRQTVHGLESNIGASDSQEYWNLIEGAGSVMKRMFGNRFLVDEVKFAAGVLETNSFTLLEPDWDLQGFALYGKMSLLAHSCKPNARFVMVGKDATDFTGAIVASVDIRAGELITIRYQDILEPTYIRREVLQPRRHFFCRCERCEDPTELGLYFGTTCCPRCKGRKKPMSILEPSGMDDSSKCRCKVCGFHTTLAGVRMLVQDQIADIAADESSPDPDVREKFLERVLYPRGLFHPTFELIVLAKKRLLDLYGNTEGYSYRELSEKQLLRKLTLCREVLAVLDVLAAGYTKIRGDVLVELVHTLVETGRRAIRSKNTHAAQDALAEATTVFNEVKKIFAEPSKTLKINKINVMLQELRELVQ